MTKTKTKRTIWTILILVAVFAIAAIFYIQNTDKEPEKVLEDVVSETTIKAEDRAVDNEGSVIADQSDKTTTSNTLEYLSEYQTTKSNFNALGVSWEELNAKATDVTFYMRVKNNGTESEWYKVDKVLDKTDSGVSCYAAETPVLAEGNAYQYKITFKNTSNEVRNVRINIINTSGATETTLFQKLSSSLFGTSQAVAAPAIISRATWGAGAPNNTKAELQAYIDKYDLNYDVDDIYWPAAHAAKSTKFIVHHTAGANNPSNPAAAVRAIWVYHTFSRGWGDIGYNYLIDQYGKIYEGRFGGDHVIAGHAAPYNYDEANDAASIGVSVLGDFSTYVPNSSILSGLGKIIGYKSYLYNINPLTTGKFEDKTTYNIAGHKNYTATACPGTELYNRLGTVRTIANTEKNNYGHTVSGFTINNTSPLVGDTINGQFTIKNTSSVVTTLSRLKLQGRYGDINMDFLGFSDVVLQPMGQEGDSFTFSQSKTITAAGVFDYSISYLENGVWRVAAATDGVSKVKVTTYATPYNVKMSSSLKTTEFPLSNAATAGTFTLENTGDQPVTYDRVKIVTEDSGGQTATNSWALSGVLIPGKSKYNFTKNVYLPTGNYTLEVEYYKDGVWDNFSRAAGVFDTASIKVYATSSNLILNSGINLSKKNLLVGENTEATFSIANIGDQPIRLSSLGAYGLKTTGSKIYFPSNSDLVLCNKDLLASFCDYSGTYTYKEIKSFGSAGSYSVRVSAVSAGVQQPIATNMSTELVSASASVTVQAVNYNNIVIQKFRTNDATPAVGQPTTVTYKLYNGNSYPITFDRLKIDGRLANGARADFVGLSGYTIPAKSYLLRTERRIVSSTQAISYRFVYLQGGAWRTPVYTSGVPRTIKAVPHYPNLKVVSSLAITPKSALAGSSLTATFKIKNYESATIYIKSLKVGHTISGKTSYFSRISQGLPPGATITYTGSEVVSGGGTHSAFVVYSRYNGSWTKPKGSSSSVKITTTFKVYIEMATLYNADEDANIPLPASTGKTAREQHLAFTCQESRSHHYSTSGTTLAAQNGMAWETSGGCGYGAWGTPASAANERYYINMRWNYTDLHGQAILAEKSWYYGKKVVITNPANGKKVVAAIIEYGPGVMSRVSGLSPEAMLVIGAVTDNTLNYAWASDQSMPLGLVN